MKNLESCQEKENTNKANEKAENQNLTDSQKESLMAFCELIISCYLSNMNYE